MPNLNPTRTVSKFEREELAAQRMACSLIVKGCESALFRLGLATAEANDSKQAHLERRAGEITREIVASWRGTQDILRTLEQKHRWPDVETIESWLQMDPALADGALASSSARFESRR